MEKMEYNFRTEDSCYFIIYWSVYNIVFFRRLNIFVFCFYLIKDKKPKFDQLVLVYEQLKPDHKVYAPEKGYDDPWRLAVVQSVEEIHGKV